MILKGSDVRAIIGINGEKIIYNIQCIKIYNNAELNILNKIIIINKIN